MSSIVDENSSNSSDIESIISLVPRKLKAADKILIAKEIIAKRVNVDEIAPRLHISRSTLYSYAEKFKNHEKIEDGNGRPRCLDDVSIDAIINAVENDPEMGDQHLKRLIAEEYVQNKIRTNQRCHELIHYNIRNCIANVCSCNCSSVCRRFSVACFDRKLLLNSSSSSP